MHCNNSFLMANVSFGISFMSTVVILLLNFKLNIQYALQLILNFLFIGEEAGTVQ